MSPNTNQAMQLNTSRGPAGSVRAAAGVDGAQVEREPQESLRQARHVSASGGFDSLPAEMPGSMWSGRREPVRGVASLSQGGESQTTTRSRGGSLQNTASIRDTHGNTAARSRGAISNGLPAAAAAVPIVRYQQGGEPSYLPISPPSTPPSSPPTAYQDMLGRARHLTLSDSGRADDEHQIELDERRPTQRTADASQSAACSAGDALLKAAAASVATSRANVDASQDASRTGSSSQAFVRPDEIGLDSTQWRADKHGKRPQQQPPPTQPLMPNTPEATPTTMSPAEGLLRHQPTASAFELLQSIYPLLPSASSSLGVAQDAGVELVCSKWRGAVLDEDGGTGTTSSRSLHVLMPNDIRAGGPLRDEILALLDLASERLACGRVIIAMERAEMEDFPTTLHGLCYVGAQVVSDAGHTLLVPRDGVILAGIDLM
ncbi:Ornithine decarboxylase antizyme [Ceraceosorus bombacis]|uniref:Ornithine decarboxylase antizyme n=1 Tax=Ceraceosorus bombacis TaxID=401625 RepID=A0A0P1BG70_9BASI|nr:Ornithine decarboxylase antizyme [Ceraceosorus bombacis]